jgi:MFS family permease
VAYASIARRVTLPAPFRIPGFAGLWVSASTGSFARVVTQLALSWVTLEATGSPFWVGVVTAARMAPQLVLGIPAGALSDSLDRRWLLVGTNAATVGLLVGLMGLAGGGLLSTSVLIGISLLYGVIDTVRMSATQSYAYHLVRATRATSSMALTNLGVQALSTVGGLAGGYVLDQHGSVATFAMTAVAVLIAGGALLPGGRESAAVEAAHQAGTSPSQAGGVGDQGGASTSQTGIQVGSQKGAPAARASQRPRVDLKRALTLLARNRLLAVLSLAILLAEIFGFASQTLLPVFARDVWDVGASGLGLMTAVRSGGGAFGLLILSRLGAEGRAGLVFLSGAASFGLTLLLFAVSPVYALALGLLALSGMCASIMDTLGQTLIQRNAAEGERGTAMGVWVFSVGFGPIGHLSLGAAASTIGAPLTQAISGLCLIGVAGLLSLHAPLRRAR